MCYVAPLLRLLAACVLALAALALVQAVRDERRECAAARDEHTLVVAWKLGTPAVERFRSCLDGAHQLLAPGALVALATPAGPMEAAFFRRLWAAYLVPDLNWLDDAEAHTYTHYEVACGEHLAGPRFTLLRELPDGALYWIG